MDYASSTLQVWQYDEKKKDIIFIGETIGPAEYSQYPDHNGIVARTMHTGTEGVYVISMEHGKLKETKIGTREDSQPDFGHYVEIHCKMDSERAAF